MEMTNEQMEFEMQKMEAFFGGGNKNAGQLVETKTGLVGRTYNHENLINGKVRVYTEKGKMLCDPTTLKLKGFIVWDKNIAEDMSFAMCEMAWTSFTNGAKIYKTTAKQQNRIHPTQKPVTLYKWILNKYTNENDLILDTHLGSGSIAIACHYMKRKLIGYEIDKEYYDAACKRFKDQTMQQALW